jgi:hypothetical protein
MNLGARRSDHEFRSSVHEPLAQYRTR